MIEICPKHLGGCEGGLTETDYEVGFCTQCGLPLPKEFLQYGETAQTRNRDISKDSVLRGNPGTYRTGESTYEHDNS